MVDTCSALLFIGSEWRAAIEGAAANGLFGGMRANLVSLGRQIVARHAVSKA
jgi:hypothetical protein